MRDQHYQATVVDSVPLAPYRLALRDAKDALDVAELIRTFQRLDPADRAHILTLSHRLADWHHH